MEEPPKKYFIYIICRRWENVKYINRIKKIITEILPLSYYFFEELKTNI